MTDPLTGAEIDAQLGSDRRLKTIYDVNLRSAFQKAQYDRTMASDLHPYLMYRVGNAKNTVNSTSHGTVLFCRRMTLGGITIFRRTDIVVSAIRGQSRSREKGAMNGTA